MLFFTVFTPTYNRAHTLRRVFDSLNRQAPHLFEWLVVDDGSVDDTAAVLDELTREAPFRMRVLRQANGGKHRAHNTAIQCADGELTVVLDSDDELAPGALARLWREWESMPDAQRAGFAGVIGHSADAGGRLVGSRLPSARVDGRWFELIGAGILQGEKLPCYRTDILRRFPFPERPGCHAYVPEGIVWTQIGTQYPVRCVDEIVRIYHRDARDTGAVMNRYARRDSNAWGRMHYCATVLNLSGQYWPRFAPWFAKAAAGYVRYAFHSGCALPRQKRQLQTGLPRTLWALALPIGSAAWAIDRLRE